MPEQCVAAHLHLMCGCECKESVAGGEVVSGWTWAQCSPLQLGLGHQNCVLIRYELLQGGIVLQHANYDRRSCQDTFAAAMLLEGVFTAEGDGLCG
jgi:hypothetical protein